MDRLWAPWRINYIKAKKSRKCIFCASRRPDTKNYVIFKTTLSIAVLNTFPYNNGHAMVSPLRHTSDISGLKQAEVLDLFGSLSRVIKLLGKTLKPHGYNIGINISDSAGAGETGHLHIHIVPRWKGDTNFMPVLAETKIISQSLDELLKQLKKAAKYA